MFVCVMYFLVSDVPSSLTTTNKDELIEYLKLMYTMRRMEITNDTEYKVGHQIDWLSSTVHYSCYSLFI